ncbi:ribosomal protein S18-alanine N-acetyltransferase [Clostridiaceae bacterium HFYG-1003]|nr:ribosomal protein S18-alanine N-acetyltransferase [Clostridiaceae bacterium HFYG-1003]
MRPNMDTFSIHRMEEQDLEAIHQINALSFSSPWSREAIQAELHNEQAYYLTARADGQTVGYAGAWLVFDEVQITNIAVHPQMRGRGIAGRLLQALIEDMRERSMAVMFLEVRVSNQAAIRLYESAGFQYAGYRKGFYPDKEDAHVMSLKLPHSER